MYDLHFEITNNNHEKERMWLLPIHFEHFHIVDFPVIYMIAKPSLQYESLVFQLLRD